MYTAFGAVVDVWFRFLRCALHDCTTQTTSEKLAQTIGIDALARSSSAFDTLICASMHMRR